VAKNLPSKSRSSQGGLKREEASFFQELFGELEPGERVELRPINRHDKSKPSSRFFKSVQEFIKAAAKQTPPFDQYFGANIRNGNRGKDENVKRITSIYADVDFKSFPDGKEGATKSIQEFPLLPTVITETGHGYQLFWIFKEPEEVGNPEAFKRILKGVQRKLKSDPVHDLSRVLRVPGTLNHKFLDAIVPCKIISSDYTRRYVPSDFEQFTVSASNDKKAAPVEEKIRENRNIALTSFAGTMRRRGANADEIFSALQVMNTGRCDPPLADSEVRIIAKGIANRYKAEDKPKDFTPPDHWFFRDATDFDNWDVKEIEPIIEGLICKGNFVIVAAPSQTMKTLLSLYLCRHLIHGGELFDKFPVHPVKKILYLALEDPDRRLKDRLLDTDQEFTNKPEEGRLVFHFAPGLTVSGTEHFAYIEKLIVDGGFDCLFVDTYQKATPGVLSFDDIEQSKILHRLASLTRKHDLTLINLDHLRKFLNSNRKQTSSFDDIKGTGAKMQNADSVILLDLDRDTNELTLRCRSKEYDEEVGVILEVAKRSYTEGLKFKYVGEVKDRISSSKQRGEENRQKVLEATPEGDWIESATIAKETGLHINTVKKHLKSLVEDDLVDQGGENRWVRYSRIAQEG